MFLSGLTCTDQNFIQKSGAQRAAAQLGIALVSPDTSPRGLGIDGEDDSYDFGTGDILTMVVSLSESLVPLHGQRQPTCA